MELQEQITVYTPESELKRPGKLLKAMIRDLVLSMGLAWRLTVRDIAAQYRQTFLGYLWAILPPLATSLTFILLNHAKIFEIKNIQIPYPVFVMTGTIFWQLFVDALNAPLKMVSMNKGMLSKINFPKEALILSGIAQVLFSFMIKLLLLAATMLLFKTPVSWMAILVSITILGILALGTLIGVLLVPIGTLYQDIQQGLAILLSLFMFFSPVVYLPPESGIMAVLFKLNPLTPLLMATRDWIFAGGSPYFLSGVLVTGVTLYFIMFGWIVYRVSLPILIERMEA